MYYEVKHGMGLPIERKVCLDSQMIDLYLPDKNVVIECVGPFGRPRNPAPKPRGPAPSERGGVACNTSW